MHAKATGGLLQVLETHSTVCGGITSVMTVESTSVAPAPLLMTWIVYIITAPGIGLAEGPAPLTGSETVCTNLMTVKLGGFTTVTVFVVQLLFVVSISGIAPPGFTLQIPPPLG